MRERNAVRIVPRSAVTVAIENQGSPLAYGVVADISEAGACLWTNRAFRPGENLVLKLSFANEPQPLAAPARIVWMELRAKERETLRCGVQWAHPPEAAPARLRALIGAAS